MNDAGDDIWSRDEMDSPCIKLCVIDPQSGLCLGCHRSLDEIAQWSGLTPAARRAIMAELPARGAKSRKRQGGRAARITKSGA